MNNDNSLPPVPIFNMNCQKLGHVVTAQLESFKHSIRILIVLMRISS